MQGRKSTLTAAIAVGLMAGSAVAVAAQEADRAVSVERLATFDHEAGQLSEGVAVAQNGDVYASLSPLGQLVRVTAGSDEPEVVGSLDGLAEGDFGLIGLAVGPDGAVYGGVFSSVPELTGVWRFDVEGGDAERVAGTGEIGIANEPAFDDDGNMYVSDTIAGAVWRVPPGGEAEPWISHPLLEGTGEEGFGFPIGANGVEVHDGTVYVGVTETAQLVSVPINDDGSAGEAEVFAQLPEPIDGIDIDDEGNVYSTHPLANLVTVTSPAGEIAVIASVDDGLDGPTSVALGPDGTAYVANFSVALGTPVGAGPGIVALGTE
jgi:sugar lactone lactonase YvrE